MEFEFHVMNWTRLLLAANSVLRAPETNPTEDPSYRCDRLDAIVRGTHDIKEVSTRSFRVALPS